MGVPEQDARTRRDAPGNAIGDVAGTAPRVAMIMLTVNQRETTLRALASLRDVAGPHVRMLLWDNGSDDGTAEAVRDAFPDVLVHRHPRNLGVASGRNAAAELAIRTFEPTHLLFMDNDMVVMPGFIDALLEPFGADPALAQTQAKLLFLDDPTRLNDAGGCDIRFWLGRTKPVGFREIDRGQFDAPARCISCGGAMMVRTDAFLELGGFDTIFDPFGPEDLDFSLRLYRRGYHALYVPRAVAHHAVSHTYGASGFAAHYARHRVRHWMTFMRRHAPLHEQLGFFLIGGPLRLLRIVIREAAKGNIGALRGLWQGARESLAGVRGPESGG